MNTSQRTLPVRFLLSDIVLIALLLTLGACNSDRPHYTIGVSQCSIDNWRDKLNMEMQSASYASGEVTLQIASSDDDNALQEQQIADFINREVDLLVVAPNQQKSLSRVLKQARQRGIPVIIFDRKTDADLYDAFIGADNYEAGRSLALYLATRLEGTGTVLEFQGLDGSSPAADRHRGFSDALQTYAGISVVDGGSTDWTSEDAERVVRNFLAAHPDLHVDAIFGHNDRIAVAADKVWRQLRQDSVPLLVGVDALPTSDGGIQRVIDGTLAATYSYPTRGDLVIDVALSVLHGDSVPRETYLSSTLVTPENAEVMLSQIEELRTLQERVTTMNGAMVQSLERYNLQRLLFVLLLIIAVLVIFITAHFYRTLVRKRTRAVAQTNERLRFFTNVSHEFRTPLTLIADPLERIAASEQLSTSGQQMLTLARRQVGVMRQLASQILDLRKIQNGRMDVRLASCDVAQLVRQWAADFQLSLDSRGLSLALTAPPSLQATTDEQKLERIFYNILSNAMKYAPRGTSVTIRLGASADARAFELSVSDAGCGMSAREARHVFDRFYQASGSVGGTGIGLSLVHDLVEMLGGRITVESAEGQGTTFHVSLPSAGVVSTEGEAQAYLVAPEPQPAGPSTVAVDASGSTDDDGSERRLVLIVDDNDDVRSYLSSLLQTSGYEVLLASDGAEALERATAEVPDLVISDVMMPVMTGHQLCSALKRQVATSHIPVILLTAQSMDEQRAEGYDTGADAYITKPFSSRVLLARVRNLIMNRSLLRNIFALAPAAAPIEAAPAAASASDGDAAPAAESSTPSALPTASAPAAAPAPDREDAFLIRLRDLIRKHLADSEFSVEMLADEIHLSRVQMYRKVKMLTGRNPVELIREARLLKADALLREGPLNISEVAYAVGFTSPSYFTKCYKAQFGHNPTPGA